jgi:phosphoenolpyruvate-protein kinase (PTS system EI component)
MSETPMSGAGLIAAMKLLQDPTLSAAVHTLIEERDEARSAAREILDSVCLLLPDDARVRIQQRAWSRWPWLWSKP